MKTSRLIVVTLFLLMGFTIAFFGSPSPASSSAKFLGITLTPTDIVAPTDIPTATAEPPTPTPQVPTSTPDPGLTPAPVTNPANDEGDPIDRVQFLPPAGFSAVPSTNLPDLFPVASGRPARLVIPAIHVNAAVNGVISDGYTWDIRHLGASVGWLAETARPFEPGNTVLVGHVYVRGGVSPFKDLWRVQVGQEIQVVMADGLYVYRVTGSRIVDPAGTSILRSGEGHVLTLITCANYSAEANSYLNRFVVTAEYVKTIRWGQQSAYQRMTAE